MYIVFFFKVFHQALKWKDFQKKIARKFKKILLKKWVIFIAIKTMQTCCLYCEFPIPMIVSWGCQDFYLGGGQGQKLCYSIHFFFLSKRCIRHQMLLLLRSSFLYMPGTCHSLNGKLIKCSIDCFVLPKTFIREQNGQTQKNTIRQRCAAWCRLLA